MEAIAEDAECSVHSLYAAFGGREALLQAVYRRYLPALDVREVIAGSSQADLVVTVRAVYRLLADRYLQEPRVLAAVLAETLARPTGSGAAVLIEHGAPQMIGAIGEWLDGEVAAGRVRDLPRPVLIQQLMSPISVYSAMRPGLSSFPHVELPDVGESCDLFADAFVRAVSV
jgi:AcrR family transcriptional regulator